MLRSPYTSIGTLSAYRYAKWGRFVEV